MADYEGLDYDQLAQAYMRLLEERGSGFRGIPYEGAGYTSKDSGGQRWREGEVEPNVGFLDPVDLLSGLLASKGAGLVRGAGRALTEPGPSMRGMLHSQRGSTGGVEWPWKLHRSEAELEALAQRLTAAMAKDPTLPPGSRAPRRLPGEDLMTWENQLRKYETRYNFDDIYNRKFEGLTASGEVPSVEPGDLPSRQDMGLTPERIADYMEKMSEPQRRFQANEARVNPYEAGKGPAKRTIDLTDQPVAEPTATAQDYADIIRKLFEREGP